MGSVGKKKGQAMVNRDRQAIMVAMDRVAALREILDKNPADAFARYGLALEYSRQGKIDAALAEFHTLLAANPEYVPAYQMAGQMLAGAERPQEACQFLRQGIAIAQRAGNTHAQSEMETLLEELARD
jgi:predicted Zn-dependent protease